MLTRRQSLPPLASLPPPSPTLSSETASPFISAETQRLLNPANDEETSKKQDKPITPGGSFSPEVTEFLQSFKRTHHRTGSNGSAQSIKLHRRQGSNGSARSFRNGAIERRGDSTTGTPLKGSQSNSTCSIQRNLSHRSSVEHTPVHRQSGSSIPYSKLDMSESDNEEHETGTHSSTFDPLTSVSTTESPFPALLTRKQISQSQESHVLPSEVVPSTGNDLHGLHQELCSNESGVDTPGTDGHEADSEANDGDCESTGEDEDENPLDGQSESYDESPQSPFESDEVTSSSTPDLIADTNSVSNLIPTSSDPPAYTTHFQFQHLMPSSAEIRSKTDPFQVLPTHTQLLSSSDTTASSREKREGGSSPNAENSSLTSVGTVTDGKIHGQVAMLISQFESNSHSEGSGLPTSSAPPDLSSPQPAIPIHIRRESHDVDTCGSYSPAKVEESLEAVGRSVLSHCKYPSSRLMLTSDPFAGIRSGVSWPLGGLGNSVTTIVRHFFENVGNKEQPKFRNQRSTSSTELEDSGIQVPVLCVHQSICLSDIYVFICPCIFLTLCLYLLSVALLPTH